MSDPQGPDQFDQDGPAPADQAPLDPTRDPAPRRSASLTLGAGGSSTASEAGLLDPANQSLADALKITFRLIQIAMLVLGALFITSGFQTVEEGQRGIAVRFGAIQQAGLEPGLRFAWPYPFGEMVKVDVGAVSPRLGTEFWPAEPGEEDTPVDRLRGSGRLNPEEIGSLITADLNIAHSQWRALYRRSNPGQYAENVLPGEEERLVRSALERGVIHAVAETTIDELLRPQGDTRTITRLAQDVAQQTLDAIGAGITVEQFDLQDKIAPVNLLDKFRAVYAARSQAQTARSEAEAERARLLSETAGRAAAVLLEQIDAYEAAVESGAGGRAAGILARIDALLAGETIEVDGDVIEHRVGGEVAEILTRAANDEYATVQRALAEREFFLAKVEQFAVNPSLTIASDWQRAFTTFYSQPFTQAMAIPPGSTPYIVIDEDPEIVKQLQREVNRRRTEQAMEEAERRRQELRFRTQSGIVAEE